MISESSKNRGRSRRRSWLTALLEQKCPRCREGAIFRGAIAMNPGCRVCGLAFDREPGYFLGAMYFSYAMGVAILVPLYYLLAWLLPAWPSAGLVGLAALAYLPFVGLVYRYARVCWIYFDRSSMSQRGRSI